MAKVINPLLSGSASGQLGRMMTFDKRGFVRQYVVPSNPRTASQVAVRDRLGDVQRELKRLGAVLRSELKSQFGYRWNSMIVGELTANDGAVLDAYVQIFNGFDSGDKAAWAAADGAVGLVIADGALLFACAKAVYDIGVRLGASISLTAPVASNASIVGAEWHANS